MITGLVRHLWQATLFVGAAWLVALVLQRNRAQARYWIWVTASAKFLIPFSLLVRLGTLMPNHASVAPARTGLVATLQELSRPLTPAFTLNVAVTTSATNHGYLAAAAIVLWACGFAAVAICWLLRWMRVHALRKSARAVSVSTRLQIPVPVMVGADLIEPGIFGVFRPVLLLPEGIRDRLNQTQLDAILAHEFCHVRRRDNLTATIHMAVQAIFWFHSLTWWIGARLVDERERACDEDVLRLGCSPNDYAESILLICKLYLSSPLACVSGVTGASLKQRMEAIMKNQVTFPLDFGRKLLLGALGAAALLLPLLVGLEYGPALRAQTAAKRPVFTVASVKLHVAAAGGGVDGLGAFPRRSGDRISWHNVPLQLVALYAYGIPAFRLSGNLLRTFDETYDIDAVAEGAPPEDQLRLMFRSLLEDRFAIKIHWETRDLQIYRLLVSRNGSRLSPSGEDSSVVVAGNPIPAGHAFVQSVTREEIHLSGGRATMNQLVDALSLALRQPVVDQTGLTGTFDFDVKFQHDADLDFASGFPEIVPALEKTLGLRLESGKGPFEMLVIDHLGKLVEN